MRAALADVRRAHRLVWSYQRRILDMVSLIAGQFEEHGFYVWETGERDRPAGRTRNPTEKWAWDLNPLYDACFLYLPAEADRHRPEAGQWMLEIVVETDDGFEDPGTGDEPDATDFADAASASSTVSLYAWLCTAGCERNWLNGVWHQGDWPEEEGEPVDVPGLPFRIAGLTFDLADLVDEDAVVAAVARFKAMIGTTLGIGQD